MLEISFSTFSLEDPKTIFNTERRLHFGSCKRDVLSGSNIHTSVVIPVFLSDESHKQI